MYTRILAVVDKRPEARAAVIEATALAQAQGAELVFFTALPRYTLPIADMPEFVDVSPQQFEREARAEAERLLAGATAVADKAGVRSRTVCGGGDDAAEAIIEVARRRRCELIVVTSEGRNAVLRLLAGSVIPGLITASPVPVLVCKPRHPERKVLRAGALPKAPLPWRKQPKRRTLHTAGVRAC